VITVDWPGSKAGFMRWRSSAQPPPASMQNKSTQPSQIFITGTEQAWLYQKHERDKSTKNTRYMNQQDTK
jgi:hypothetical protein